MTVAWPQCANCGENEVGVESATCRVRCSACGTIFEKDHWVSRQIRDYYEESLKGNSAEDRAIRGLLAEFLSPGDTAAAKSYLMDRWRKWKGL